MVYSEAEQEALYLLFPQPADDNGNGAHGSSGGQQHHAGTAWDNWGYDILLAYYKWVHDFHGIRWWKLLGDGSEGSIMHAKAIKDAGIEPIVRIHKEAPHWWFVVDWRTVAGYAAVGCRYFEYGNEPNLGLEVQGVGEGNEVRGRGHVVSLCNQFIANTTEIVKGGGICLIPAMAPGNVLDDTGEVVCHQSFIKWFQNATLPDGSRAWDWFVGHCKAGHIGVAFHPRGGNHVVIKTKNGLVVDVNIDYPYDPVNQTGEPMSEEDAAWYQAQLDKWMSEEDFERKNWPYILKAMNEERVKNQNPGATLLTDSTSYIVWDLIDDLFREALGFSLPGFATEAGAEIFESWEGRYPRTTPDMHGYINLEIIRRMNPKHSKAARRSHFCNCFWVYDNEGHGQFQGAGWVNNQLLGRNLPVIFMLEEFVRTENFVRTWDAQPVPEPEPIPEPVPTPEDKMWIFDFKKFFDARPQLAAVPTADGVQVTPELVMQRGTSKGKKVVALWTPSEGTTYYEQRKPRKKA